LGKCALNVSKLQILELRILSGKRHHFLPKFLQKGFAIEENSKTQKIWVYKKNSPTYPANIIDSGVEGYFYGVDGDSTLDDEITTFEDKYGRIIHSARTSPLDTKLDKKSISKLIYNFEIRTRNLRQNFRESMDFVVQEVLNKLSNPKEYEKILKRMIDDELNKLIDQECEQQGVPRSILPLYRAAFKNESKDKLELYTPLLHEKMKSSCEHFKELVTDVLASSVKNSHIKAMLESSKKTPLKLKWYEQLEYSICETGDEEIPLGDSIILFHVKEDRKFKNFLDDKKSLIAVILPISPKRIIYGTKNKNYVPDFSALKQAIISNSKEFFLFSSHDDCLDSLKENISTNSHILSEEEIKNIILN
jgi:gamma-glutamylcyclotransferase (GGCT)/AIG2-like uncharacterized protein YtfP